MVRRSFCRRDILLSLANSPVIVLAIFRICASNELRSCAIIIIPINIVKSDIKIDRMTVSFILIEIFKGDFIRDYPKFVLYLYQKNSAIVCSGDNIAAYIL
ncbi:MAG: hypothetical protein A2056_05865 [Deltaproteobacteria bacterium GWA2_42_85]|nr:MAG: hypothetical protein A2056_05865 [Deltaproteobacteria bacterium GWA2_42_85]OGP48757.1 MAG: hypothetical protein A2022_00180 [Deltaproteobacteria bacterium GWF2_42_12]OGQ72858.1 MAG: hypothetical protein A2235_06035 [Deltaproteobacteria bacterium RIFOXYA2_FULL_42_10]